MCTYFEFGQTGQEEISFNDLTSTFVALVAILFVESRAIFAICCPFLGSDSAVIYSLLVVAPIVCVFCELGLCIFAVLCMLSRFVITSLCCFLNAISLLRFFESSPRTVDWSVVCDVGISWSYSLTFLTKLGNKFRFWPVLEMSFKENEDTQWTTHDQLTK